MGNIIFGGIFMLVAIVVVYATVVKGFIKKRICTEEVQADVLESRREKRRNGSDDFSYNYNIIAQCRYSYNGNTYESEVEFEERYYDREVVCDTIRFYINPKKPESIYIPDSESKIKMVMLLIMMSIFFSIGKATVEEGISTMVNSGGNNVNTKESLVKKNSSENREENVNLGDVNVEKTGGMSLDSSEKYIKESHEVILGQLSIYLAKEWNVVDRGKGNYIGKDVVKGDVMSVKIIDNNTDYTEGLKALDEYVQNQYKPTLKPDNYKFNGNYWNIYTLVDAPGKYRTVAVSANDKKRVLVVYKGGKDNTRDIRDILGTVKY